MAHGKQAGSVPAGLLRWAEEVLTPKVNWRALLAAELRRAVAEVSGAVDYSYRRPSRRSATAGPVVLPALRRPVPEVAVVCDTSGSMTGDLLAMVLAEVEGLLRALGLARQVRVLACDTAVAPAQRVSSARQVQLVGGGGTDMGAGIDAAAGAPAQAGRHGRAHRRIHAVARGRAEGHAGRGRAARRAGAGRAAVGALRPGGTRLNAPWAAGPVCAAGAGGDLLSAVDILRRLGGRGFQPRPTVALSVRGSQARHPEASRAATACPAAVPRQVVGGPA